MIRLSDCMTVSEASKRYGVEIQKIHYRINKLETNHKELYQLINAELIKKSGERWLITSELMDIWFVKKERTSNVFPQKVQEYIKSLSNLDMILEFKALIAQQELKVRSSDDYIANLAFNLKIPYHVAVGFKQLASIIDVTLDELKIRNWKNKRIYYNDPRRSNKAHQSGSFYYCMERMKFINPYHEEEVEIGLMEGENIGET